MPPVGELAGNSGTGQVAGRPQEHPQSWGIRSMLAWEQGRSCGHSIFQMGMSYGHLIPATASPVVRWYRETPFTSLHGGGRFLPWIVPVANSAGSICLIQCVIRMWLMA